MAKIYFHTKFNDNYPEFESDVIPRKGDLITIENDSFFHTPWVTAVMYDYKHINGKITLEHVTVHLGNEDDL
jgi:hypothetical protein